jgi:secreted PhoX family phosphatase
MDDQRTDAQASSSRRDFLRRATRVAGATVLAPSLQGLVACATAQRGQAARGTTVTRRADQGEGGYGPIRPAGAQLALPVGFTYTVLSTAGKPMSDGNPTPNTFDGMATFAMPNGNVRLIRNHENRDHPLNARVKGDASRAYDPRGGGGCTSLEVRLAPDGSATLVRDFMSLNGTIINCAGGPTPWGSWLSCEETTDGPAQGWGMQHGYIFEVPASAEDEVEAVPLKAMGRFVHEAVAVDPDSGIVYETEDRLLAGFYRFLPTQRGVLRAGGKLQMLAIEGRRNVDLSQGQRMGVPLPVTWVDIDDPDRNSAWDSLGVFAQGYDKGAARFARLEGCWYGDRSIYVHATNGGNAKRGQIWQYRATGSDAGELTLIFESPSAEVLDGPDNVTVSPRGGIVICEDGAGEQYIRGLTRDGRIFDFAKNLANNDEFAGACFSPDGRTLFLNIMGSTIDAGPSRGMTIAIWGPWQDGAL